MIQILLRCYNDAVKSVGIAKLVTAERPTLRAAVERRDAANFCSRAPCNVMLERHDVTTAWPRNWPSLFVITFQSIQQSASAGQLEFHYGLNFDGDCFILGFTSRNWSPSKWILAESRWNDYYDLEERWLFLQLQQPPIHPTLPLTQL